jgi:nucleoside-diphosphate-sugar epimerase
MRIIVFGAGGFIGGWICEHLSTRPDVETLGCIRKWAAATRIARRGINVTVLNLEGVHAARTILSGASVVVNAAMPAPTDEPELVSRLYAECAKAGVERFIQFSSAAVYGDQIGHVHEDTPPMPVNDYARGKVLMEQALLGLAAKSETQVFILRPSIVYGPFSEFWTVRYAQRILSGRWRGIGDVGDGTCNLIHANDIASAVFAAANGKHPKGSHILNLNGPEIVTWNEYIDRFGEALGVPQRQMLRKIPFLGKSCAAELIRRAPKWAKTPTKWVLRRFVRPGSVRIPALNPWELSFSQVYPPLAEIKLLRRKVIYGWDRASAVIGFSPIISLNEGIRQSSEWCRRHGVTPGEGERL